MDSKKRGRHQITPDDFKAAKSPNAAHDPLKEDLVHAEPSLKKTKIEVVASNHTSHLLNRAIRALTVDPSLFQSSDTQASFTPVVGREKECGELEEHFRECLTSREPQPVFLCGPPGCGKTASINKIFASHSHNKEKLLENSILAPYTVKLNCATDFSGSSPSALYKLLCTRLMEAFDASAIALALKVSIGSEKTENLTDVERLTLLLKTLNQYHIQYSAQTENTRPYFIMVLVDEIDHLLLSKSSFSAEIHFLFSVWLEAWGILSIVAISNAHDLFERNLPSLATLTPVLKGGKKNTVRNIAFKPYSADQLETILSDRIARGAAYNTISEASDEAPLDSKLIFDMKATKFLCGKVAKLSGEQAGDVRVLIDLAKSSLFEAKDRNKCPVTLDIIILIWKTKMAPPTVDPISQLTLQQKCTLLCMLKVSGPTSSESVRPVTLETQWKASVRQIFPSSPPDLSELWSAIALLEGIGHIQITTEKGNRKTYKLATRDQIRTYLLKDPILQAYI